MKVNAIYSTFNGEVNPFGIGSPTIFLRLQGCPIRCYKRTLSTLCDTPEALKKPTDKTPLKIILDALEDERNASGASLITLSGGDPLWNDEKMLKELLVELNNRGFPVCIETSGTISWLPYMDDDVYMILDYKLKSAGIKNPVVLFSDDAHLKCLRRKDFIKFVIYDTEDYEEFKFALERLTDETEATIAVGAYWGGKLDTFQLFTMLQTDGLLGRVTMNMQTHKMAVSSNFEKEIPKKI